MHCNYLGSRDHIFELVTVLNPREATAVVDAVTINREGVDARLRTEWDSEVRRAVVLRPEARTGRTTAAASDYLSWLDDLEQRVAACVPTTVIELPRSPRDWEIDIRQAIDYGVLCLVDPGGGMSLVSRSEQDVRVAEAVEAHQPAPAGSTLAEPTQAGSPPAMATQEESTPPARSRLPAVSVSDVVEALADAAGDAIASEVLTEDDMRTVLTDAGMAPRVAQRIVGAQHLAVTCEPTRASRDCTAALEEVAHLARTIAEEAGKER